jgi:phosphohistidine phosphatase
MNVTLLRHGIAVDREDPGCPPDAERFLTPKGIRRTRESARGLAALGVTPRVILSSDLVRARQTAEIVAEILGYAAQGIRTLPALRPEGTARAVIQGLMSWKGQDILCVGHAPSLDLLLAELLGLREKAPFALGKAGAAQVELESLGSPGVLRWCLTPRGLRALGGAAAEH